MKGTFDGYIRSQENRFCLALQTQNHSITARVSFTSRANQLHLGHTCPTSATPGTACPVLSIPGSHSAGPLAHVESTECVKKRAEPGPS